MKTSEYSEFEPGKRLVLEHFARVDKKLCALAEQHLPGISLPSPLPPEKRPEALMKPIIGQQISTKAADSIWNRLYPKLFAADGRPANPSIEDLTAGGASAAKARSLTVLCEALADGRLDMSAFGDWGDEQVIEKLTEYPGIGPWTAEMFMIRALGRPDIFSLRDLGLRTALSRLHNLPADIESLQPLAQTYSPYGTLAALVCWRSLDNGDLDAEAEKSA